MTEAVPTADHGVRGSVECIFRHRPTPLDPKNVKGAGKFLSHAMLDGTIDFDNSVVALAYLENVSKNVQPPLQLVLFLFSMHADR